MIEDKNMNGPKECHNCDSDNVVGPFDFEGRIFFSAFSSVHHQAFVCSDCFHTMLFISKKDEDKMMKEMKKTVQQHQ